MRMEALPVVVLLFCTVGLSSASTETRHPCDRECTAKPRQSMVCEYDMEISYYYTMSKACFRCPHVPSDCLRPQCIAADGVKRAIIVVNRSLPGPQIRVCENDTIVVNVMNALSAGDTTTIHWHGIYQRRSPHMDGVPLLTQCPILEMNSFQYRFQAYPAGTHFWHSHVGFQRGDGASGALIVKSAADVHRHLYDHDLAEHTVLVQDWTRNMTVDKFTGHFNAGFNNKAQSIIINGKGDFEPYYDHETDEVFRTPRAVFNVAYGYRYRFRIVGSNVLNCPIEISIDNHKLLVIASDGSPFEPVEADVLTLSGGERYDFIVTASEIPQNYWFYARGLADCSQYPAQQLAVLHYIESIEEEPSDAPRSWNKPRRGVMVNPFNEGIAPGLSPYAVTVAHLKSAVPLEDWVYKSPNKRFYLSMDMYAINNKHYNDPVLYPIEATIPLGTNSWLPQINRVTNILLGSPALTRFQEINKDRVCEYTGNSSAVKRCSIEFCECMQIIKVNVGDIVEFVMIDEGVPYNLSSHAIHLHGHHFRVMSMWQSPTRQTSREEVIAMDAKRSTRPVTSNNPILKDTVILPDGGYTIVKFKASPGLWFLHCHNEFHALVGMALIVQVGQPKDWPAAPTGFPTCGSWKFPSTKAW